MIQIKNENVFTEFEKIIILKNHMPTLHHATALQALHCTVHQNASVQSYRLASEVQIYTVLQANDVDNNLNTFKWLKNKNDYNLISYTWYTENIFIKCCQCFSVSNKPHISNTLVVSSAHRSSDCAMRRGD